MKSCEGAVYLHYLLGGPEDGRRWPANHCYEKLQIGKALYYQTTDKIEPCEPGTWEVINDTEDYKEFVFYRVNMRYSHTE